MRFSLTTFGSLLALLASAALAAEVSTVVDGLSNPCGIAVQPGTGTIYVADSGAGRVVRIVDGKAEAVITDFPADIYGKGPKYQIGAFGLAFLYKDTLVVGGGGLPDGEELLRVYALPADGESLKAADMKESFSLAADDETKGEGNFYALALTDNAIYVTCNGDDTKGWVSRAKVKKGKVGPFERYLPTKEATEVDAPVGITVSPRGELVVGQMGEITIPEDGLLTFYNPKSKKMLLNLETGLSDITALAYSPKGLLYALDFSWFDTSKGGLFRIDKDGNDAVKTTKIAPLTKPTSMAFGKDGALYITVIGEGEDASKTGSLVKITDKL